MPTTRTTTRYESFSPAATTTLIILFIFISHGASMITNLFHLPPLYVWAVATASISMFIPLPGVPVLVFIQMVFMCLLSDISSVLVPLITIFLCAFVCIFSISFATLSRYRNGAWPPMSIVDDYMNYYCWNGLLGDTRLWILISPNNNRGKEILELIFGVAFLCIGVICFLLYCYLYDSMKRDMANILPLSGPTPTHDQEERRG